MNHVIRLRGPWQFEVVDQLDGAPPPRVNSGKQPMPGDWSTELGSEFRGTVAYRRVFHRPTGLEPGQSVWLVIESLVGLAEVSLNQTPLGTIESTGGRFAIESILADDNRLEIVVTHHAHSGPGGLTGLVSLEIQTVRPRPID